MPPTTPPAAPPMPLWLPSTTTGRIDSTVASCTTDIRCASPRWITSGLDVAQAARTLATGNRQQSLQVYAHVAFLIWRNGPAVGFSRPE